MRHEVGTNEGRIIRVWIDEDMCLSHGLCQDRCPEVFELRDGIPKARIHPGAAEHYVTKKNEIESAAHDCPTACIHIEREVTHDPPMQRTGTAGIFSLIRKLLGRGSGR